MRRPVTKMLKELRRYWKSYLLQSALAMVVIFLILMIFTTERAVIVTSLGASVFIVFAMPKSLAAQPPNLVGGHILGLACGVLCRLIPHGDPVVAVFVYSLAVGLSILGMVITDTEHPPASGTALQFVTEGFAWGTALGMIGSVVLLSILHRLLGRRLRDLA